ncbi:hypothetical protein [Natrarchaeobaculum aegyptiacum]|uniref:Uncharacterized protein n=1 Tax=Natrarchaeobaculum aegyptiacum TaxID=745377 RepID=A0A2Z2I2U2_9EURY|nr:hypothetical protein [Natrarchaeobaculum aegyptiacum]ARS91408.1 hypothetical protein B1756_17900 [Natrarchaeobaculum aegyptiacum]
MPNSPVRMGITALLALATILWLPYALADWTVFDAVGTEGGVMIATLLFIAGVYDLAETAGVVEYPA